MNGAYCKEHICHGSEVADAAIDQRLGIEVWSFHVNLENVNETTVTEQAVTLECLKVPPVARDRKHGIAGGTQLNYQGASDSTAAANYDAGTGKRMRARAQGAFEDPIGS